MNRLDELKPNQNANITVTKIKCLNLLSSSTNESNHETEQFSNESNIN